MKAIRNFIFLSAAILGLAACTSAWTYELGGSPKNPGPGDPEGCPGVFFPEQQSSFTFTPAEETVFDLTIKRKVTSGSISVPISVSAQNGEFSVGAANFSEGQAEAKVQVSMSLEVAVKATATFTVPDEMSTAYANSFINVSAIQQYTWTSLLDEGGNKGGMFFDYWMFEDGYQVDIQQCDQNPKLFRVVHPYDEGLKAEGYYPDYYGEGPVDNLEFTVMSAGDPYPFGGPAALEDGDVYFEPFRNGYCHSTYGEIWNYPYWMSVASASVKSELDGNYGSYVAKFQDNGLPAVVELYVAVAVPKTGTFDNGYLVEIFFPGCSSEDGDDSGDGSDGE